MKCDLTNPAATCPVCGFVARRRDGRLVVGCRRRCPGRAILPRLNVGTWIETAARFVGITSERVERLTRRPCGCRGRRDWLNAACHRLAERGDAVLLRAWRRLQGK